MTEVMRERWSSPAGTVYLLHFDKPFRHARHYLGWSEQLPYRLSAHEEGRGARLTRAARQAGIGWRLVRTWPRMRRADERRLKRQHGATPLCPVCTPGAGAGRWRRLEGVEPHRAAPNRSGRRCQRCRGRVVHVAPARARAHWRHLAERGIHTF